MLPTKARETRSAKPSLKLGKRAVASCASGTLLWDALVFGLWQLLYFGVCIRNLLWQNWKGTLWCLGFLYCCYVVLRIHVGVEAFCALLCGRIMRWLDIVPDLLASLLGRTFYSYLFGLLSGGEDSTPATHDSLVPVGSGNSKLGEETQWSFLSLLPWMLDARTLLGRLGPLPPALGAMVAVGSAVHACLAG